MSLIKRKGNECVENLHGKWVGSSADGFLEIWDRGAQKNLIHIF